jgi:multiple sugar transport system permease protein
MLFTGVEGVFLLPETVGSVVVRKHVKKTIVYLLLIILGLGFALPFAWVVSTSLKPDTQIFVFPPRWIPDPVLWSNYPKALRYIPFLVFLRNTLIYCAGTVIGAVISSSLVAYSCSRISWPGRNVIFFCAISTMMLPYQVTMIPLFIVFRRLGWVGSYKPLIVPAFFGQGFYIFLLRQFFLTIPLELSDAARIDGCSHFGIYWRVMLPIAKPALATVALFRFMSSWNDFLGPLIYLNSESQYTLSLGLRMFLEAHRAEWALLMAASVVVTVPIIVLFFFTQRTFIQGVTMTGLKG